MGEILGEAAIEAFGTVSEQKARYVREKMRALADMAVGFGGKRSETDPEAVAESVVEYYIGWARGSRRRFDVKESKMVRNDVMRYRQLCDWILRFVPLLEEKLEKRSSIEREVSELRHDLQEEEGLEDPPPA